MQATSATSTGTTSRRNNLQPKYATFNNWNGYSGINTNLSDGWQYKTGKYEGQSCVFYRRVPFVRKGRGRAAI